MKEKRLRDGKRRPPKDVVVKKEETVTPDGDGWYSVQIGTEKYRVMDPETCLHIGRHNNHYGVVYKYWGRNSWGNRESRRGPVYWDGEGGQKGMIRASLMQMLKEAGIGAPPKWLLERMEKPGFWGSQEFWQKMLRDHKRTTDFKIVREVMES